jgi:hypothetical protein
MTFCNRDAQSRPYMASGARRAGLTTIEFVGCATAVVGGIWLGLLSMGVNVQHLAHSALSQADLMETLPEGWRPAAPMDKAMNREQVVANLRDELGTLQTEIASLRAAGDEAHNSRRPNNTIAVPKQKTLAFWRRLSKIALNESMLQQEAELTFDESNAAKVFAVKARISRFAAKAVDAIPNQGAHPSVVEFGQQLRDWYDSAGDLYERAVQIWESPSAQTRAQLNKDWRRAELQQRNEARLLFDRAAAVRGSLGRQFGLEFPEFATPAAATPPTEAVNATTSAE